MSFFLNLFIFISVLQSRLIRLSQLFIFFLQSKLKFFQSFLGLFPQFTNITDTKYFSFIVYIISTLPTNWQNVVSWVPNLLHLLLKFFLLFFRYSSLFQLHFYYRNHILYYLFSTLYFSFKFQFWIMMSILAQTSHRYTRSNLRNRPSFLQMWRTIFS